MQRPLTSPCPHFFLTGLLGPNSVWLIPPSENPLPTCLHLPLAREKGVALATLWTLISTLEDLIPKNLSVLHSTERVYLK